jgi:hypothetical protein
MPVKGEVEVASLSKLTRNTADVWLNLWLFFLLGFVPCRAQTVHFYKNLYLEDVLGNSLVQGLQQGNKASLVFEATQFVVSPLVCFLSGAARNL